MTEEEKLLEQERNTSAKVQISGADEQENGDYANTMAALRQQESSLPEFSGSYDAEIQELYGKIVNRGGFKYSPSADPLYGAYRDRYTREGALAMRDSMGQAAALTGGYSSSYAQSVGQQQYDAYLQKLSDAIPELYSTAYQQYKGEGERLTAQLQTAKGLAADEYGRHRDSVADAQFGQELQADMEQQSFSRQQSSFNSLMQLISATGYQPSAEELQKAGMSQGQADALVYTYQRLNGLLPAAAASAGVMAYSGGSGSSGGSSKGAADKAAALTKEELKLAANAKGASSTRKSRRQV